MEMGWFLSEEYDGIRYQQFLRRCRIWWMIITKKKWFNLKMMLFLHSLVCCCISNFPTLCLYCSCHFTIFHFVWIFKIWKRKSNLVKYKTMDCVKFLKKVITIPEMLCTYNSCYLATKSMTGTNQYHLYN